MADRFGKDYRDKQRAATYFSFLERHLKGELELTGSQIKAAEILLRKCMPDLKAIDIEANVTIGHDERIKRLKDELNNTGSAEDSE